MFELLGFTDLISTFWNILAYVGMSAIIVAVVSKKYRDHFFVWGPLALILYAWFFLHNPLLAGLQLIITVSGALNFLRIKKGAPWIVGILTAVVYSYLLTTGSINGIWNWIGSLGLWAIGMGLTQLPKKRSFLIMCIGGILLVVYSGPWALKIWIWFVLNIIFAISNFLTLLRNEK